jgi:hypothetical protein
MLRTGWVVVRLMTPDGDLDGISSIQNCADCVRALPDN